MNRKERKERARALTIRVGRFGHKTAPVRRGCRVAVRAASRSAETFPWPTTEPLARRRTALLCAPF